MPEPATGLLGRYKAHGNGDISYDSGWPYHKRNRRVPIEPTEHNIRRYMERIRMICHYRGFEDVESKAANITMVKEGDYLCMNISPGSDDILVTLIELDTRHRNRPVRA